MPIIEVFYEEFITKSAETGLKIKVTKRIYLEWGYFGFEITTITLPQHLGNWEFGNLEKIYAYDPMILAYPEASQLANKEFERAIKEAGHIHTPSNGNG